MIKKIVLYQFGRLLILVGLTMLLPLFMSLYDRENIVDVYLFSIPLTMLIGFGCMRIGKTHKSTMHIRDGYMLVTMTWLGASLCGSIPMALSGYFPTFLDAFFETLSGFTATGITVLADIESIPRSLLLWRSITQWLGGLGIVVLFVAILSGVGTGGMQLIKAEITGPIKEKLRPRISDSAKSLWAVYMMFTIADAICLWLAGMDVFDSVNHALTTISTGGFSTKNANLAAFPQESIQWVTILFMLLSGMSFALFYRFRTKPDIKIFVENIEWRFYMTMVVVFTAVMTWDMYRTELIGDWYDTLRETLFTVVALISSTGFVITDFDAWPDLGKLLVLILIFCGGCAGSTAGGLKLERILIVLRQTSIELKNILHPRMVTTLKIDGHVICNRTVVNVSVYAALYIVIILFATLVAVAAGLPILEGFTTSLTCVANGGPTLGAYGPTESFTSLPAGLKAFDCLLMLIGRLELYTVLVLFVPTARSYKESRF